MQDAYATEGLADAAHPQEDRAAWDEIRIVRSQQGGELYG